MTDGVRTTSATVHCAVYRTDRHASVNLFITACSMDDHDEEKRPEQNLFVRSGKSEAEVTNNSWLRSAYWQTRSIARPLCDSRDTCSADSSSSTWAKIYDVCETWMRTTDSISEFTTWRFCNIFMKQDEVLCVWTVFVRPSLRCGVHATSLNAAVALGSNNVGLLAVIEAAVARAGSKFR